MKNQQYKKNLVKKLQRDLIKSCESNLNLHKKIGELKETIENLEDNGMDDMDRELAKIEMGLIKNNYAKNCQEVNRSLVALDMINPNFIWN
jgi:cell division protein FtsB